MLKSLLRGVLVVALCSVGAACGSYAHAELRGRLGPPPTAAFVAEGAEVTTLAVCEDGTRIYKVFGPKMIYASIVVVGPDGRAAIRQ